MPKRASNKKFTGEFKQLVIETMRNEGLQAKWDRNTYTATLNYDGGHYVSGVTDTSISFNIDDGFTLPKVSKSGFTFNYWSAVPVLQPLS